MKKPFVDVPAKIWIVLSVLTVLAVGICEGEVLGKFSSLAIMLIAAIKVRLVILHYMEAKHAAPHWRFLYETWNFSAMAIIVIGHYVTLAKVA